MEGTQQPILLTSESQENVRKWIETLWKLASGLGAVIGTVCLAWMTLKYATKEDLQGVLKELQLERDVRSSQHYEMINQLNRWDEQKEINVRHDREQADHELRLRTLEHRTVSTGRMLDNTDLGHP